MMRVSQRMKNHNTVTRKRRVGRIAMRSPSTHIEALIVRRKRKI